MAGIINFSEAVSIAIHGMALIVKIGHRISSKEIADLIGASEAHLSKVFQRLVKCGYLDSVRGPGGGFVISRPVDSITLFDIYSAIEGVPDADYCPLMHVGCPLGKCIFGGMLQDMTRTFIGYMKEKTLADLADGSELENNRQGELENVLLSV